MLDYTAIHLIARMRALALSVAASSAATLSVTATGYQRHDGGSFYVDGFYPGMEVRAAGFANADNNGLAVIREVTPELLTVDRYTVSRHPVTGKQLVTRPALIAEGAAAGRTLLVGLPAMRAWEGRGFEAVAGVPYVEEQFLPGPAPRQISFGPNGLLEAEPMYALLIHLVAGSDLSAGRYTDAVLRHFAPRTALPLANGDVVRVRSDAGPFIGQLQAVTAGVVVKPCTIPLRIRTANSI